MPVIKSSVLVVDDHKMVCEGIAALVQRTNIVHKVFVAFTGTRALEILKHNHITVALIDARMRGFSGIELIRAIRAEYPSVKIIGMTSFDEDRTLKEILNARVDGLLLKRNTDGEEIKNALEHVFNNQTYFNPEVDGRLKEVTASRSLPKLTLREKEIVDLLCKGHSTKEIAMMLSLSPSTVEDYRKNLLEKCNVKNVAELVALIHLNGLV